MSVSGVHSNTAPGLLPLGNNLNMRRKSEWYSALAFSLTTVSLIDNPISSGCAIGINARCSSDFVRPFQKKNKAGFMLSTESVFLFVALPSMPLLKAMVSENPYAGMWQLAQLMLRS